MENDWKELGKQMPYRTPTDFFARNKAAILAATVGLNEPTSSAEATVSSAPRNRRLRIGWQWAGAVAASIALIALAGWWATDTHTADPTLYAYAATMGDEELDSWVAFYEDDLFLSADLIE